MSVIKVLLIFIQIFRSIDMINEEIKKVLSKYENIESILYMTEHSQFQTFQQMQKFIEAADASLSEKIEQLQEKYNSVHQQFVTSSTVYEMNNKKRQKEQQLLQIQRDKLSKQLEVHKQRLDIKIHPMTMVLKQKKYEIERLMQTKDIIADYSYLIRQSQDQANILPLDQKNFKNSALKIYVFKTIFDQSTKNDHLQAKMRIDKKYAQLKHKIFQNFQQGFVKKQQHTINVKNALPYCDQYNLLNDVSDFYNHQAFGGVNIISKIGQQNSENIIGNFFFLIEQGFNYAFAQQDIDSNSQNPYQLNAIFKGYSQMISKKLITFVFEKLIKESLVNCLNMAINSYYFLLYLECFYRECKNLINKSDPLIKEQKIFHLMSTYFQSIFDVHLETYLQKQLNNLYAIYTSCAENISEEIRKTEFIISASRQMQAPQQKNAKGLKKLLTDYKIEQKPVISLDLIQKKIQALTEVFEMNPNIEKIFDSTKKSLTRNNKIAKINQMDKNRNQILGLFVKHLGQIIQILIKSIAQLVPKFSDKIPLHHQFFQLLPNVMMILQRMEFLYEQYKKQAKYQFSETLKLEQKKQSLLQKCEKQFYHTIGQALASILSYQSQILRSDPKAYEGSIKDNYGSDIGPKLLQYLQKYLRVINKINLQSFRNNIMKLLGDQLMKLLIDFYSRVKYTKDGVGKMFIDFNSFKRIISQIDNKEIDKKFKHLYILVDIYILKNDQRQINQHFKDKKEQYPSFKSENEEIIKRFIENKQRNQRV